MSNGDPIAPSKVTDLTIADVYYPVRDFNVANPTLLFHFSIFEEIHHSVIADYGFLNDRRINPNTFEPMSDPVLVFGSRKSRTTFRRWWKRYTSMFVGKEYETSYCPLLQSEKEIRGTVMPRPLAEEGIFTNMAAPGATMRAEWAWIVEQRSRKVWRAPGCFIFQSPADAVAFKLRFG